MKTIVLLCGLLAVVYGGTSPLERPRVAFTSRVVGGQEAQPHEAPFTLSYQFGTANVRTHICGASLIRANRALCAAHCFIMGAGVKFLIAGAHQHGTGSPDQSIQVRQAGNQIPHPSYAGGVGPFDIGVIQFNDPFTLTPQVALIALPATDSNWVGAARLFGWGSTSTTDNPIMPTVLMTVTKPVLSHAECEAALNAAGASGIYRQDSDLCTGPLTGGIGACSGDSGGPLVQNNQQVGVVAWGFMPCGSVGAPSVYARTSAHLGFINPLL